MTKVISISLGMTCTKYMSFARMKEIFCTNSYISQADGLIDSASS